MQLFQAVAARSLSTPWPCFIFFIIWSILFIVCFFSQKKGPTPSCFPLCLELSISCVQLCSAGHGVDAQWIFAERISGTHEMFIESMNKSHFSKSIWICFWTVIFFWICDLESSHQLRSHWIKSFLSLLYLDLKMSQVTPKVITPFRRIKGKQISKHLIQVRVLCQHWGSFREWVITLKAVLKKTCNCTGGVTQRCLEVAALLIRACWGTHTPATSFHPESPALYLRPQEARYLCIPVFKSAPWIPHTYTWLYVWLLKLFFQ